MAIKRKPAINKVSFSVQVSQEQDENIYAIAEFENIDSKAEVMRNALDYYVQSKYPQLMPQAK